MLFDSYEKTNDDFVEEVRSAISRGITISSLDLDYYHTLLAQKKCDTALANFDRLMTPAKMWLMDHSGFCGGIYAEMLDHHCPLVILQTIEDVCTTFVLFSSWNFQKGDYPRDWAANRHNIERDWPLREELMFHLRQRLMACAENFADEILEWYRARAMKRWKRVRLFLEMIANVKYWIHVANKPGSCGHMSCMRFFANTFTTDPATPS